MSDVTVKQLADVVGTPVERLLEQLIEAGLKKKGQDDRVSDTEKLELLDYLRRAHGKGEQDAATGTRKITLRRKSVSELRVSAGAPGRKTVNVEVRGKRTYVKRSSAVENEVKRKQDLEEERAQKDKEAREQEQRRIEAEAVKRNEEAERKAKEEAEAKRKLEEAEAKAKLEKAARETPAKKEEAKPKTDDRNATKSKRRGKGGKDDNDNKDTRYGRDELHVAKGKAGRRKPKQRMPTNNRGRQTESKHAFELPSAPMVRDIKIPETVTVAELANAMAIKAAEVIKTMMRMGVMATINQVIDQDTAALVVEEMGHKAVTVTDSDIEKNMTDGIIADVDDSELVTRPPVVTVMGHVDHGKTSLLDYIRKAKIAAGEAGGITQHIGAYRVATDKGSVTFLDTPGHAAFTSMRARGAQCTDIVILVVAADDGVMPQTKEAIQHSRAAGVPMIVAVNKIDKPEADPERVRNELSQFEVIPEAWGGDTMFIDVSAHTGEGVDQLLEACLLQAEILELKASSGGTAQGVVIEASLDKGRGPVATVLVQSGTLRQGDIVVTGTELGRVRALFDESGKSITSAGPSAPAVILGLSGTPLAGDEMLVAADERKAKELVAFRQTKVRDLRLASNKPGKLEDVFSQVQAGQLQTVNLLVKTDVQGSYEALREAMEKLTHDEVQVKIVGGGVGGITESDVQLANASSALLIGFNVRADGSARRLVQELGITLNYYSVIYEAIDQVKAAVNGLLAPDIQERIIGLAEVKDVFKSPKFGAVAGCMVIEGTVRRSQPIRVLRDNVVIYEGELESLRRFKDDVNEVRMGTECGIAVKNYNDVKPGDQIEVFERTEVARTI